jgi:hypothetical protein
MDSYLSSNTNYFRLDIKLGGVEMNKYELEVKEKGKLPEVSFPGSYPIFYVTKSSDALCGKCATEESDHIEIHDCHMEGPPIICQRCHEEIESAYGDPENETEI